jgi:predicted dehydrogenase
MIRLGIVDCDTSHSVAFTQRLNHVGIAEEQWVSGATVVAAFPGTSQIHPEVIDSHVHKLREWGVDIVNQPSDLIGQVDAVLVESVDGSVHLDRALPFAEAGIPLFVDKPLATTTADAFRLVETARLRGSVLHSASALRYAMEVQEVGRQSATLGPVLGASTYGPASLHPRNPGLFHYGVHAVEMLYALLGPGCRSVSCIWEEGVEVCVGRWADGRLGTVRGTRSGIYAFGFTAFCENQVVPAAIDGRYFYRELLKVVVNALTTGDWPLSPIELLEPVAFQVAALRSSKHGGEEMPLEAIG